MSCQALVCLINMIILSKPAFKPFLHNVANYVASLDNDVDVAEIKLYLPSDFIDFEVFEQLLINLICCKFHIIRC